MSIWNFFRGKPKAEPQKQLPAPIPTTIECGLCNLQIEQVQLYKHWQSHVGVVKVNTDTTRQDGPMRSAPKRCSMVFIVRRPDLDGNAEKVVSYYFSSAIISLKQQHPEMRFQYVPVAMGESCQFLKTLLVVAEWDEV